MHNGDLLLVTELLRRQSGKSVKKITFLTSANNSNIHHVLTLLNAGRVGGPQPLLSEAYQCRSETRLETFINYITNHHHHCQCEVGDVLVDPTTRPADARRATAVIWRAGVDRRRAARERRGPGGAARVGGR